MIPAPVRPCTVGFVAGLRGHGEAPALRDADGVLSYRALADAVAEVARTLGDVRRLVCVPGGQDRGTVIAYLGALAGGHPVLLVPAGPQGERLAAVYDPDVTVRPTPGARGADLLVEHRSGTVHDLHPDLALLMSTSGSTGAPRTVRLSRASVEHNAATIAEVLGLGPDDVAATTLPLSYCYGLSVLHSHLAVGASVLLTEHSVVDPCFWAAAREAGVTTMAGVPHTFDLLDRVGGPALPTLRLLTQAGGRMEPAQVRRWAATGAEQGFDLVVMYGQTEATARMAWLPPALARTHPSAVGRPVPGGSFTLDPVPGVDAPGVGEIVYSGPNVMLGYAEGPADLALGRTVAVLRTGDLGRRTADGLYEVVGRRSRVAKLFGLRIDLAHLEARLAELGHTSAAVEADGRLVLAVEGLDDSDSLRRRTAAELGLPTRCVRVCPVLELPRLHSGKPDLAAVGRLASSPATGPAPDGALELVRSLLDRPDAGPGESFVDLGGDSLSYVEVAVRLEALLGELPRDWHLRPLGTLTPASPSRPRRLGGLGRLEMPVALRALAILAVVVSHVGVADLRGGAHLLMGLAGYQFARFHLGTPDRRTRLRRVGRAVVRMVAPASAWAAGVVLLTDRWSLGTVAMINQVTGPARFSGSWQLWFVEALAWILLAVGALLAVPVLDRTERARPFAAALGVVALGLALRTLDLPAAPRVGVADLVWLFGLGWAAAQARTVRARVLVSALVLLAVPGFFDTGARGSVVVVGMLLLLWVRTVPSPRAVSRAAGALAAASLYVYVTHFSVYPLLGSPVAAVTASLAVGLAYARLWRGGSRALARALPRRAATPARAPAAMG